MAQPLKLVYNSDFFQRLVQEILKVYPPFDGPQFLRFIMDENWDDRELKARMRHITHGLFETLNLPYRDALGVLKPVAATFPYGYEYLFFPDFVEVYGQDDWEASLPALEHFTQFSSSEFAVRPFILADAPRMMAQMLEWAHHPNEHVRRLASEGCRTRLPWGMGLPNLKKDPAAIWLILDQLDQDPARYVQKSVANNLNDLSKDFPEDVLEWAEARKGKHATTDWIIKHALRTLLKKGDSRALGLFGYGDASGWTVKEATIQPEIISIGSSAQLTIAVSHDSNQARDARIEYAIQFARPSGTPGRKVFQVSERSIDTGEVWSTTKKHAFRQMTTRTHYPGKHVLEVLVNGATLAEVSFDVE
ncbi:DNA alkylation repair protein [Pontibacter sp. G13]|uniref:DNA alkylation repair protein n=1 Tax=Pontibacter sp. G13 TaxID=3074898 RepID=UPI00288C5CE4|nr:DNA alkylation repair protein [Pontibacter sp. G13]WNJ16735.1 DNA alkylation repair protein [Pontibacter sp. G13]